MPSNCTEVNGYWICESDGKFDLYDPKQKCWFGFDFTSFESASAACNALGN